MSNFPGRTESALIVIDVQNAVINTAYKRDETVANIAALVAHSRANGISVVWIQHNDDEIVKGSEDWEIVAELIPVEGEPIVHKNYRSSFEGTTLDDVLAGLNVGRLIITGSETAFCVRNTIHAAYERGYDVTISADAHTTNEIDWNGVQISANQIIDELNLTLSDYCPPGRRVNVLTTKELIS